MYTELHPFTDLEKVQIRQPNEDKFRDNEILSFKHKKLTFSASLMQYFQFKKQEVVSAKSLPIIWSESKQTL